MRTTITLDPDVALLVEREMKARHIKFKEAINDALRRQLGGGGGGGSHPLQPLSRDLGATTVDLLKANEIAADLEDDELIRKLAQGR